MEFNAPLRQKLIYLNGVSATKPWIPTDFYSLESEAKSVLTTKAFAYIAGGAGLESTIIKNNAAWDKYEIVPKMLHNVSNRNLSTTFLNHPYPLPIFTCPIGVLELAHPRADLALAQACAETGVPMIVSNQASYPMEAIAKILNGSPWYFQLYVSRSDALVKSLVQRAERAGAQGIVVTLDTTFLGWRNRDLNLGYLPFLQGKGIAQYTSDPVFNQLANEYPDEKTESKINLHTVRHLLNLAHKMPGDFRSNLKGKALKAVRTFTSIYSRPDLNWDVIEQIKTYTSLPIILKGIQHAEDAHLAIQHGIQAIYVSNHGGRQVDGAIGSLDALVNIKKEVGNTIPILFDSGVRSGAHIMKALALGASMVGIGRPYAYALALKGKDGVRELIMNMAADLELNMSLSGVGNVKNLNTSIFN